MSKFSKFKRAIHCKNALTYGSFKSDVLVGDLIGFTTPVTNGPDLFTLGRVLGKVNSLRDGKKPKVITLIVMAVDDMMTFATERFVPVDDITVIRSPSCSAFAEWFLSGPLPDPEVLEDAVYYGIMNDDYLDNHLERGKLLATFRNPKK